MQRVRAVRAAARADAAAAPSELCALLHGALSRRQRLRSAWAQRARDPLFEELDEGYRPLPCLHAAHAAAAGGGALAGTLPEELAAVVDELAELGARARGGAKRKR